MIRDIALYMILGKPLFLYFGALTFVSLLTTAFISVSNLKFSFHPIPFKWHPRMAAVTITFAVIHVILALSVTFNF